jgi:hypothetical protein
MRVLIRTIRQYSHRRAQTLSAGGTLKKSEPKILVVKTTSIIKYFKVYKLFI